MSSVKLVLVCPEAQDRYQYIAEGKFKMSDKCY